MLLIDMICHHEFPVEMTCWYTAIAIGAALFLNGIVYLLSKKALKEEYFAKAAIFEVSAIWVMYIPDEFYNKLPDSAVLLKIIESILTALLKAINIYQGNGYDRAYYEGHPIFSGLYVILMTLANIVLILFITGFIVQLLDGPVTRVILSMRKRRGAYIFSTCNDKTLALADSVDDKKRNLVFLCSNKELDSRHRTAIEALKGFHIASEITDVLGTISGESNKIEVFLFNDKETDNLEELESICKFADCHKEASIRVYVELSETPWTLYDKYLESRSTSAENNLFINFVRAEENFAYNNLLKNSIFEHAVNRGDETKAIRFLLVGMNERNLEMLKAVLHLSQLPGYRLTLMVIDPGSHRSELSRRMPEITDVCDTDGDAIYTLIYKENVALESDQFETIVSNEYPDFTFAFINAGDDLTNANLALRLNTLCRRISRTAPYKIQVSIKNKNICDKWNKSFTQHIDIVGGLNETYAYKFITMSDIEEGSEAIHNVRYPKNKPGSPTWSSYCNNEYKRHSVYARTLSLKYWVWLIDTCYNSDYSNLNKNDIWKKYEHMRWNVYTRTLGYISDKGLVSRGGKYDKDSMDVTRVHPDLVPFDVLSSEEKKKDTIILTPPVVDILRKI